MTTKQNQPASVTSLADMLQSATVEAQWLVEGVIPETEAVIMYGPTHSGKTYVALDLGIALSFGWDWHGHHVPEARDVIYVPSEGRTGLARRMLSTVYHNLGYLGRRSAVDAEVEANGRFHTFDGDLFLDESDQGKSLAGLDELRKELGAALVIVDVLSDMAPGVDENHRDFGHAYNRLRSLECAVIAVHHTGKDPKKGARGSSSLKAATDIELLVTATELKTADGDLYLSAVAVETTKNRNYDRMPKTVFELRKPSDNYPSPVIVGRWQEAPDTQPLNPALQSTKVLGLIVTQPNTGMTRAALAKALGIKAQSLDRPLKTLFDQGFIEETKSGTSKPITATHEGRKAYTAIPSPEETVFGNTQPAPRHPIGGEGPVLPDIPPTLEEELETIDRILEGDIIIEHDGPMAEAEVIAAMLERILGDSVLTAS